MAEPAYAEIAEITCCADGRKMGGESDRKLNLVSTKSEIHFATVSQTGQSSWHWCTGDARVVPALNPWARVRLPQGGFRPGYFPRLAQSLSPLDLNLWRSFNFCYCFFIRICIDFTWPLAISSISEFYFRVISFSVHCIFRSPLCESRKLS